MSIDECIAAYMSLSDRVFQKKRQRVTVKGNIQGRFDAEELTLAVKEIVRKQGLYEDALLKDSPEAVCKVYVLRLPRLIHKANVWYVDLYARQVSRPAEPCVLLATGRRVAAMIFSTQQRYGKPAVQHQRRPLSSMPLP